MVELAVSRDLIHWERVGNREKFIPLSPVEGGKNYDTGQLLAANRPIIKDNELWFYYTGLKWRSHPDELKTDKIIEHPDSGAICLAKLRLDGFVSLDAGETEGIILTKPVVLEGRTLHLNLDAPKGEVQAEILDPAAKRFSRDSLSGNALRCGGNTLDGELKWQSSDLSALAGKTVRIRFALRNASLYAFWMGQE